MILAETVPQPSPGAPTPTEIPQPGTPPLPGLPPEIPAQSPAIIEPPPDEPALPVREPGTSVPAQAWIAI